MDDVKSIVKAWRTTRPETSDPSPAQDSVAMWSPQGRVGFASWPAGGADPMKQGSVPNWSVHGDQAPWTKISG